MRESGYYPPGAEFDPSAPWNESDKSIKIVEMEYYGDIVLIYRTYIAKNDWEDETENIDAEVFEEFCATKLKLNYKKLQRNEEAIDLKNIKEEKPHYRIITSHGEFTTTFKELERLI
jgi:hypothetical protein